MYQSILKVSALILLATSSSDATGRFGVTPGNCAQKMNQISSMANSPDKLAFAREILAVCGSKLQSNRVAQINTIINNLQAPPPLNLGNNPPPVQQQQPNMGNDAVPPPLPNMGNNALLQHQDAVDDGAQPPAQYVDHEPLVQDLQGVNGEEDHAHLQHQDAVDDGAQPPAQHVDHEPLVQDLQGVNGEEQGHQHLPPEEDHAQLQHQDAVGDGALPPAQHVDYEPLVQPHLNPNAADDQLAHYDGGVGVQENRSNIADEGVGFVNNGQRLSLLEQIRQGAQLNPVNANERRAALRDNSHEDAIRAGVLNRRGAVAGEGTGYESDPDSESDNEWEN
ncbi:hypothetical protein [Candidatus Odyssella acanthamoebae]|uniref:WH2 domain-containing protein n=1 Tax=Candidatus Odyssella acanthamoebae TaxID=91604 RepID=A0A077AWW7_9PROT|nr:hypothetical protein [Candidatus Paracaedibacter acanthamoebae]AIK97026.1 hypothetical protein ID47_10240 [Candidatus Paracaedibacter acanthamoebae]